jgi:hypothetical protein
MKIIFRTRFIKHHIIEYPPSITIFEPVIYDEAAEAKKIIEVLKTCNCEEYKELKEKVEKYK